MNKKVLLPYDQYLELLNAAKLNSVNGNEQDKTPYSSENVDSDGETSHLPQLNQELEHRDQAPKLTKEMILSSFGDRQIRNAETLLKYIANNMSWNEEGEIVINNEVIKGTHITDLMKDCLSQHRKGNPFGYQEFYSNLRGLPLYLVFNVKRRPLIGRGFRAQYPSQSKFARTLPPPPPGIPLGSNSRDIRSGMSWIDKWKGRHTKT